MFIGKQAFKTNLWYKDDTLAYASAQNDKDCLENKVHRSLTRWQNVKHRNAEYANDDDIVDTAADVLGVVEFWHDDFSCFPG